MTAPEIEGLVDLEPISAHAFRALDVDGCKVVVRVYPDDRTRGWAEEEPGGRWVSLPAGGAIVRPWFEADADLLGLDARTLVQRLLPVVERVATLHSGSVAHGRIEANHLFDHDGALRLAEPAAEGASIAGDTSALCALLRAADLDADQTVINGIEEFESTLNPLLEHFAGDAGALAEALRTLLQGENETRMETRPSGSVSQSAATPIPERIAEFEVRGLLGRGGMGFVYEAYDAHLERELAIKTVRLDLLGEEGKQRFLREARACSRINHPNVVTVYAAGEIDGDPYMAMELVRGRTLREVLKQDNPGWETLVGWIASLLDALESLHAEGIVHRDLKPENVMITENGTPKLMDFGLAHMASGAQLTETGVVMGTVHYMSPEQVLGQEVDARSDVFSMGVLLHQSLSGELPFHGDHPMSILYAIQNTPAPKLDPSTLRIPAKLQSVVETALAKEREARFASAGPFRDALLAVLEPDTSTSGRRTRVALPIFTVVAAIVAFLIFLWTTGPDREAAIQHNELAQEYQAAGDLAEARAEFRRALVADPGFEVAWNNLGLLSWNEGTLAEADSFFRRAADFDPSYATPRFNRARMLEDQARWPQAESAYRVALTADDTFLPAYNNLAALLLRAHRIREALDFANMGLARASADDVVRPFLLRTLGRCLSANGETAAAIASWEEALQSMPDDPSLYEYLAENSGSSDYWGRLRELGDGRQQARADSALSTP